MGILCKIAVFAEQNVVSLWGEDYRSQTIALVSASWALHNVEAIPSLHPKATIIIQDAPYQTAFDTLQPKIVDWRQVRALMFGNNVGPEETLPTLAPIPVVSYHRAQEARRYIDQPYALVLPDWKGLWSGICATIRGEKRQNQPGVVSSLPVVAVTLCSELYDLLLCEEVNFPLI